MERTDLDWISARDAYRTAPWNRFANFRLWDGYWFEGDDEVVLHYKPNANMAPRTQFDLIPAKNLHLALHPRSSADAAARTQIDGPKFGAHLEHLRITTGNLQGDVALALSSAPNLERLSIEGAWAPDVPGSEHSLQLVAPHVKKVTIRTASVIVTRHTANINSVEMANSLLQSANKAPIELLGIRGRCEVRLDNEYAGTLLMHDGSRIAAPPKSRKAGLYTDNLVSGEGTKGWALAKGSHLDIYEISDSYIRPDAQTKLRLISVARRVAVQGPSEVIIEGVAEDLAFLPKILPKTKSRYNPTQLRLETGAIVQNVKGAIRLVSARNAQIIGNDAEGLEIDSIDNLEEDANSIDGLVLRNFRTPVTLKGLQSIAAITAGAAVAVPVLHPELPGQSPKLERARALEDGRAGSHLRADYAAAIARLGGTKGAPGSVRTKLNWLDYRMRQRTAKGKTEKITLWLYSFLGYGERPGRPLALAGATAAICCVVGLIDSPREWDVSPSGTWNVFTYFMEWLASPLHVFRLDRDELPLGSSGWAFAGRVAVAVPAITGFLALRKYVKRTDSTE